MGNVLSGSVLTILGIQLIDDGYYFMKTDKTFMNTYHKYLIYIFGVSTTSIGCVSLSFGVSLICNKFLNN